MKEKKPSPEFFVSLAILAAPFAYVLLTPPILFLAGPVMSEAAVETVTAPLNFVWEYMPRWLQSLIAAYNSWWTNW